MDRHRLWPLGQYVERVGEMLRRRWWEVRNVWLGLSSVILSQLPDGILPRSLVTPSTPTRPEMGLIALTEPRSVASEAFRTLRTNIQFAGLDQPCRSILVTSAGAEEGKTTLVANFGVVVAQAGARVCLIDSDLRRPSLHRVFELDNVRGLTTALVEELSFADVAQPSRIPNLSILTSGPLPPNPAELVGSHRMRDALQAATQSFDLILCDSPPVSAVGDATALAALCDGVILVIRAGRTGHDPLRRVVGQIEAVKGRILGVLLNWVELHHDGYYYYAYRTYEQYAGRDTDDAGH